MASEKKAQTEVRGRLECMGFEIDKMHGNLYQQGFPDLLLTHKATGKQAWVEMKAGTNCKSGAHALQKLKGLQRPRVIKWGIYGVNVFQAGGWDDCGWWVVDWRDSAKLPLDQVVVHRFADADSVAEFITQQVVDRE